MKTVTLYRIINTDGTTVITPIEADEYDSLSYRLIADEGMILSNGEILTMCIDTDHPEEWEEIVDENPEVLEPEITEE